MSDTKKAPKWAKDIDISSMKDKSLSLIANVKEKAGPALMRTIDGIGEGSQKA